MSTFMLNGCSYENGDQFRITTPELGTLEVNALNQHYGKGSVVGLDLGFIKTQLPCTAWNGNYNARLSLYSNGEDYNTIQLAYHCSCSYNVHSHCLTWYDLLIDGFDIVAPNLGQHFNQPHNHPTIASFCYLPQIHPVIIGLGTAKTEVIPKRKGPVSPDPETGKHGQFLIAF